MFSTVARNTSRQNLASFSNIFFQLCCIFIVDGIDFINAESTNLFFAKYISKGRQVAVEGRLQIRSYDGNDGQRRWVTEVIADNGRPIKIILFIKNTLSALKGKPQKIIRLL